jgi:type II secretory pathway pseudopilin PulG
MSPMMKVPVRRASRQSQSGMLLIGVLVLLALTALAAVQTGQRWYDARQRANEEELLFVGEQYRQAIESYWREAPNTVHQMPTRVEDLVVDNRFPFPKRHLRKVFRDPLAPDQPLVEIRDGAALLGVYSQAEGRPFRQVGFEGSQKNFNNAVSYADWKFSYLPQSLSRGKAPAIAPDTTGPIRPRPVRPTGAGSTP